MVETSILRYQPVPATAAAADAGFMPSMMEFDDLPDDLVDLFVDEDIKIEDIDAYINARNSGDRDVEDMLSDLTDDEPHTHQQQPHSRVKASGSEAMKGGRKIIKGGSKAVGKKLTDFARKKDLTLRDMRVLIKRKIPPLMKEDIRRKYMGMFANVWNSHDEGLIGDFMSKYCVNNVFMVNECAHAKELNLPPRLELVGQQPIFEFWHGRMIMFPDTVFELLSTKVRSKYKPDTLECVGSVVEARIAVSGTRMFELAFEDWVPSLHRKDNHRLLEGGSASISVDDDEANSRNAKKDDRGTFLAVDEEQLNDSECAEREHLHHLSREWQYTQKKERDERVSVIPLPPASSKPKLIDTSAIPDLASVDTGSSLLDFCKITPQPKKMRMEGMMMLHVDKELRIQRFDFHGIPKDEASR